MLLSGHARDWSKGFDVARSSMLYHGVTEIADLLKATHFSTCTTAAPDVPATQLCNLKFSVASPLPLLPKTFNAIADPVAGATFGYIDEAPLAMLFAGAIVKADSAAQKSVRLVLDYGAVGVALTTITPVIGAFLDGTFASSLTYKVVADGVDAVANTTVTPSGQTLTITLNKTVKVLEIILTVTNGGLLLSKWLPNTSTLQTGNPVAPYKGLLLDPWGGNVLKIPALNIVYGNIVGSMTVEPVF